MSDTTTTTTAAPTYQETTDPRLKVIEGLTLRGMTNVSDQVFQANIASAIRRGHPQLRRQAPQGDRICLVGGGPSLTDTMPELLDLLHEGAKLVTVNGAYQWALEHNLTPSVQVMIDGRALNRRFLDPPLLRCNYLIASTCAPEVWDALEGREKVWIFHPVTREDPAAKILDDYYLKNWESVPGGTTVMSRAIFALRLLGYLRFDAFGLDCCWLGDRHHAYEQPENNKDKRWEVRVHPTGHPEQTQTFCCSGWHLKAYEDWLQIIRTSGDQWLLNVHGPGLLATTIQMNADLADAEITEVGPATDSPAA